jgi:hypothetical protein
MHIQKLRIPMRIIAAITLLAILYANAQDRVSKPGEYSGYSRKLYREVVRSSQYLAMRDGKVSIITDGRLKGSLRAMGTPPYSVFGLPWHRSFQEDAQAFVPGQPAEVVFDCLPLSHLFAPGHRIRMTITWADPREKDRMQLFPPPTISIHRDAVHSSYITLPIIY